jgi:hypothetical protein
MKLFTGLALSAGLVLTAAGANAQVGAPNGTRTSPYRVASDVDGPHTAMPPEAPAPGPILLPAPEVYTILRESGFSPLGNPQLHGFVYTISVIDRSGGDGRLIIDARTGQILRFIPAYRMGDNLGPARPLPPIDALGAVPRPPASVPRVASRTPVPLPKASPSHTGEGTPLSVRPAGEPVQQSAAVQAKPADAPAPPQAEASAAIETKPAAPLIRPTQEMPKVQGLE